jgi:hypothetical protein
MKNYIHHRGTEETEVILLLKALGGRREVYPSSPSATPGQADPARIPAGKGTPVSKDI